MALFGAWHAANFHRAKRMPTLETAMSRLKIGLRKPKKSADRWLADFERLAQSLGGEGLKRRPQLKADYMALLNEERP